jgi:hypothetical protein
MATDAVVWLETELTRVGLRGAAGHCWAHRCDVAVTQGDGYAIFGGLVVAMGPPWLARIRRQAEARGALQLEPSGALGLQGHNAPAAKAPGF